MMLLVILFTKKTKQNVFCRFSPLPVRLVEMPVILSQQELDYGNVNEVWKTCYLVGCLPHLDILNL